MSEKIYKAAVEAMRDADNLMLNPDALNAACYGVIALARKLQLSKEELSDLQDVWTRLVFQK